MTEKLEKIDFSVLENQRDVYIPADRATLVSEDTSSIPVDLNKLRGILIVVEGSIGVGKTTAGKAIEENLKSKGIDAIFYPEYVNNDYLNLFLSDMKAYAFGFQSVMLSKRIAIYREARAHTKKGGVAIVDRSILGDIAFAVMHHKNGNINSIEWAAYLSMVKQELKDSPDYIIYLDCELDEEMERIRKRSRGLESTAYTREYLSNLKDAYMKAFEEYVRMLPVSFCLRQRIDINWYHNIDPNIILQKINNR